MGYVYKITNTINNKAYIKVSLSHEPTQGRIKHHLYWSRESVDCTVPSKSMRSLDAFVYEVLEIDVFDEFLPDLEPLFISLNLTLSHPHGYNLTRGGNGSGSPSEQTRQRPISITLKVKNTKRFLQKDRSGKNPLNSFSVRTPRLKIGAKLLTCSIYRNADKSVKEIANAVMVSTMNTVYQWQAKGEWDKALDPHSISPATEAFAEKPHQ